MIFGNFYQSTGRSADQVNIFPVRLQYSEVSGKEDEDILETLQMEAVLFKFFGT